jgi:hypothetical protein
MERGSTSAAGSRDQEPGGLGPDLAMDPAIPTSPELERLLAAVRADQPAFLNDLARLVGIDCGSWSPEGVDEVGRLVAAFLAGVGAEVETYPDPGKRLGATVVGRIRGAPAGPDPSKGEL